jgi:hypothetical protein
VWPNSQQKNLTADPTPGGVEEPMDQPTPLVLMSFSRHQCRFQDKRDMATSIVLVKSPALNSKNYVPHDCYVLELVEGDDRRALLSGELSGYDNTDEWSTLTFAGSGIFSVEWKNYLLFTCKLVSGHKYSLIVAPAEEVAPA